MAGVFLPQWKYKKYKWKQYIPIMKGVPFSRRSHLEPSQEAYQNTGWEPHVPKSITGHADSTHGRPIKPTRWDGNNAPPCHGGGSSTVSHQSPYPQAYVILDTFDPVHILREKTT